MQANGKPSEPHTGFQPGSVSSGRGKLNNGGDFSDSKSSIVDVDTDQEVTKLVTTPDIQCYEDMDGPDTPSNGTSSKASSPPPLAAPTQPPRPPSISNSLHKPPSISNSLHNSNNQTTTHVAAAAAHAAAAAAAAQAASIAGKVIVFLQ